MKKFVTIAAVALTVPFAAQAERVTDEAAIRSCVNAFVAEHFPEGAPAIRIEPTRQGAMPLMLRSSTTTVQVVAQHKVTGRTLVAGTCKVRGSEVIVATHSNFERVAQN